MAKIKHNFSRIIERAQLVRKLRKTLRFELQQISNIDFQSYYDEDLENLPLLTCHLTSAAENFAYIKNLLIKHDIRFEEQNNTFKFNLDKSLDSIFYAEIKALKPSNAAIIGTETYPAQKLTGYHYRAETKDIIDRSEQKQESPTRSVSTTLLSENIDFKEYGFYHFQSDQIIKLLMGLPGNFVLFSRELNEKHFKNDTQALEDFKALCEQPKISRKQGDIGFKFHREWMRNFLWHANANPTEKNVYTSIKAKILGKDGKGKKRLYFRPVRDVNHRYTLHVPCGFSSKK